MDVVGSSGSIRPEVLQEMLDSALTALLETPDGASAWERIVRPEDVVGIKSNVWHSLPTPPTLETAIRKAIMSAGVKEQNISVDDWGVLNNPIFRKRIKYRPPFRPARAFVILFGRKALGSRHVYA